MPNMLDLLDAGVPVTLLLDLFSADAPESRVLYAEETADTHWLVGVA
ncbi:MAG: hypothetical protein QOF57_2129 [Frankiaceae bacterium]|jgi:hypothetical protein|nr:hypothetical protein [Frankiaceae bacterium]